MTANTGATAGRDIAGQRGISLRLPWPPSLNTYWRSMVLHGQVRHLVSAAGRAYRKAVAAEVLRLGLPMLRLTGRLTVCIIAYPPDRRTRDLDNLPKSVLDALTAAEVWADDGQIDHLAITRSIRIPGGAITLTITEFNAEHTP